VARVPLERRGPRGQQRASLSSARRRIVARQKVQVRGPLVLERQLLKRVAPDSPNPEQPDLDGRARTPRRPAAVGVQLRAGLPTAVLLIAAPLNGALRLADPGLRRAHRRGPTTSSGARGGIPRAGPSRLPGRLTVRPAVRPAVQPPARRPPRETARTCAVRHLHVHRPSVSDRPAHRPERLLEASSAPPTRNGRRHGLELVRIPAPGRHARRPRVTVRYRLIAVPGRTRRMPRTEPDRRGGLRLQPASSGACAGRQRSIH
jgi:hypothetical protein